MAIQVADLLDEGPVDYVEAWERQKELVARRGRGEVPDTLLLLEHAPTVTYGRAADRANLLLAPEEYARRGIALVPTDRGGDVTYHGPGQLVGYPILALAEGDRDLHRYVRRLEAALIGAAEDLGVVGAGRAHWHAGVWVGDAYLAALGVRVARWVTHHGFALNVSDEVMTGFETIVPCGVPGRPVTSLSRVLGRAVTVREAAEAVGRRFAQSF
uniref:Octanoyltransferase n=1 Tax=uncultured Armatimonadetes bacterium TaxID=157466 RepID=A0A6J4HS60_9BACT|nr:Octanoate-[acyl-carrier-protein]-protein-N-octanoyltransferase [uncultured Armatimonadetes bacterium]